MPNVTRTAQEGKPGGAIFFERQGPGASSLAHTRAKKNPHPTKYSASCEREWRMEGVGLAAPSTALGLVALVAHPPAHAVMKQRGKIMCGWGIGDWPTGEGWSRCHAQKKRRRGRSVVPVMPAVRIFCFHWAVVLIDWGHDEGCLCKPSSKLVQAGV